MELNDKEFDATFRQKVFDAEPQFEEAAWDKMEQKLKKRDRVIFYRKSAALLLLLLIGFGAYITIVDQSAKSTGAMVAKKQRIKPIASIQQVDRKDDVISNPTKKVKPSFVVQIPTATPISVPIQVLVPAAVPALGSTPLTDTLNSLILIPVLAQSETAQVDSNAVAASDTDLVPASLASVIKKQKKARTRTWPMSLTLSAGPEFNSSGLVIGGRTGFSAGVGFSIGVAKRLTLQTGLNYSAKYYGADNYEYKFKNQQMKSIISGVDASCAVLEIPLLASLNVLDDVNRSIDLNAGMSSYFMLKENYTYSYTAASGYQDRFQQINGKNQHYFGVVDLSATYYVKLKKQKFRLGLEPFVKIPLVGVGEGRVNLKSSGVSLKVRYDLGKKNY
jgi:hypothetical protein